MKTKKLELKKANQRAFTNLALPSIASLSPDFRLVTMITTSAAVRAGLPDLLESFRFFLASKDEGTLGKMCEVFTLFQSLCQNPNEASQDPSSQQILNGMEKMNRGQLSPDLLSNRQAASVCLCDEDWGSPYSSPSSSLQKDAETRSEGLFDFYEDFQNDPITLDEASQRCDAKVQRERATQQEGEEKAERTEWGLAYLHKPLRCDLLGMPLRYCCRAVGVPPPLPIEHLISKYSKGNKKSLLSEPQVKALAWTLSNMETECGGVEDTCKVSEFVAKQSTAGGSLVEFLGRFKKNVVDELKDLVEGLVTDAGWSAAEGKEIGFEGLEEPDYLDYTTKYSLQLVDVMRAARNKHPDFVFALCSLVPLYVSFCVERGSGGSSFLFSVRCDELEKDIEKAKAAKEALEERRQKESTEGEAPPSDSPQCDGFLPCAVEFCCASGFPFSSVDVDLMPRKRTEVLDLLSPLQCTLPAEQMDKRITGGSDDPNEEVFKPATEEEADEALRRLQAQLDDLDKSNSKKASLSSGKQRRRKRRQRKAESGRRSPTSLPIPYGVPRRTSEPVKSGETEGPQGKTWLLG
uniref:Uncharacterized protein n=1 Tax=Chromera velia CCMP2878 TaxID=1169474 RepID=A0A0G4HJS8_9ALVE|eukprot:Cvel_7173.t1-p1 / transcript=Cvel_7173.t1 / gene=Cvel_7173 / organism=Chromera_velia_CCMP2878 / gene_product=hypothetical protein / transcript_product=hypothetical protein / location=Cvel_scaffold369:33852-37819(-) / protein_length=576 / sequence_SO=supercontig / SO=protein_coding / is_pseudo=false